MRTINKIIVHCSATPEGKDYTVKDIDRWHRERGFTKIGYHYVVYRDGTIHEGRKETEIGAHASGYNAHSIGVCYIGGLAKDGKTPKDTRTQAQRDALVRLLRELVLKYPDAEIIGHRDVSQKACPSFDAKKEYKVI
jgi:N-acetylmuramoyl-L-alanine amidase